MPLASAAETPNLMNKLDKDQFVNAVSNNANTSNSTILSKDEVAKLQQWLQEKKLDNKELKEGATSEQVKELQTWLKENHFYTGEIDGIFGKNTENAVKIFQKTVGLKQDGEVGEYTLLAMEQWEQYYLSNNSKKALSSSTSNENYVQPKITKKISYTNTKKTYYKNYYSKSSSGKYGYTNGMDCWAMSAYISGQLKSKGYTVRTIQYATSMAANHRSVQYWNGHSWVNYDYQGNGYSKIYYPTNGAKNGRVIG